uniref:Uncharacterized protein n=1 Tax=Cacopsylla melanoneura TaxID=428564 RepID=A0A8D8REE1_9HEMI
MSHQPTLKLKISPSILPLTPQRLKKRHSLKSLEYTCQPPQCFLSNRERSRSQKNGTACMSTRLPRGCRRKFGLTRWQKLWKKKQIACGASTSIKSRPQVCLTRDHFHYQ